MARCSWRRTSGLSEAGSTDEQDPLLLRQPILTVDERLFRKLGRRTDDVVSNDGIGRVVGEVLPDCGAQLSAGFLVLHCGHVL